MNMKYTQMALALTMCLGSIHSRAQNVTGQALGAQLSVTTPKIDLNLKEALSKSSKPWESSTYANANKETGLKSIFDKTNAYLKQPQRGQSLGGLDGGGGNALICESEGKFTSQLLDLYEAEELNIKLDFGPSQNFLEKIDSVLSRLAKVSPLRATIYKAMALDLLTKNTQWVKNTSMPVINDVKLATIPRGCLLVQVAVQRPLDQSNLPNAKTYIIDQDMFYLLDEDSKAALVLHEVLYREARYSGLSDSVFTRHFLGLILSNEISKHSRASLNKIFVENDVTCAESLSVPALYGSCEHLKKLNYSFNGEINLNLPDQLHKQNSLSNGYKIKTSGKLIVDRKNLNRYQKGIGVSHDFNFAGNLQIKSTSKEIKSFTFPGIKINSGIIQTGLMKIESKNKELNYDPDIFIPLFDEEIDVSESSETEVISKSDDLGKNLARIPQLVGENLKPFIALQGELEIQSPFIKLMNDCVKLNRCEDDKDNLPAIVHFEANEMSINSFDPNIYFLVYIGENRETETKNGWKKAHAISFQGEKISSVKFLGKDLNGKAVEKVINLIK